MGKPISGIWNNRDFIKTLSKREIISKYKQSLLGKLWILIEPMGLLIVLTIVFSVFVRLPSEGLPYAPFLFVALLPWMYFNKAVSASSKVIVSNAGLIRQRNFYRPALVFIKLLSETINFGVTLIGLILVLWYYNIVPGINALYAIPILLIQIIMTLGLMLLLSSTNAYVRDVGLVTPIILRLGRYLSPIMYSYHTIPSQFQLIMAYNPLTGIFDGYRQALLHNQPPDMTLLGYSFIFSIVILIVGSITFSKLEKNFADVV
ncbi:ABC transporter permease [Bacillus timonensis]|uniref:Transport permease protein n=1 Tax=Bacillus timonensis TaxID=1033734 RepID=A0A4S3PPC2_9BACI|nr:ABC transporter permease [Bacillus timonensis]THE11026.1 ABC transporter permease [Bacillus timonensis]